MARTRAATDRLSARILRRARAEMVAAVERELGSLDAIYAQVAADVQSDIRGVTSRSEIEAIARVRMNAALAEALPIIQSGVTAAAVAGARTPAETFAAIFPDVAAPRFGAQREAQRAAADVLRGRIRARDVPIARRLNQNHQAYISELGREVEQSLQAGETSWNTMERILEVRQREGVVADMPQYIERLREAAHIGGERLQKELRAAEAYARRLGSVDRANTSMRAGTEELIKRLRRANAEDIDAAVARWLEDKAQYQAKVIARHERNEAHRTAYQRSMRDKPWVKGFKWALSASHPRPDVCFPAGTMVTTARGDVPIESVVVGDLALTHLGRYRAVLAVIRTTGDQALVSLRSQGDSNRVLEVEATHAHPFATDRGWVAAGALRTGDRIRVLRTAVDCPRHGGTAHTSRSGSQRSAPCGHRGTPCEEQCAGLHPMVGRTDTEASSSSTTSTRRVGSESDLGSSSLPSSSDCPRQPSTLTDAGGALPEATTCPDGACRGLDCLLHGSPRPCTRLSRTSALDGSAGTTQDMHHMLAARDGAASGSTRFRRTPCPYCQDSSAPERRMLSTATPAQSHVDAPRTPECSSSAVLLFGPARSPFHSEASQQSNPRTPLCSLFEYTTLSAVGHGTTANFVFNIEVEGDHTYVANGFVVHNCDLLANQNLHGLGPGGYPPDGVPATPHPGCTCTQTAIIDQMNTERELAELDGTPPPPETWNVGGFSSASDWLGRQPEEMQLAILGPTRLEAFRDDPGRVLDEGGAIRRVQDIRQPARRR